MPTTGDDAIDSAFSDASSSASPTASTGDDAIDSAFGTKAASPKESVAQLVRHEATSAVMYPAALLRHAYDVTLGNRTAADADARQKAFMEANTTPITDPTAQKLGNIYQGVQSSDANPLSYPGKIINVAGNVVGDASGSPELGSATKDALQVVGMMSPGITRARSSAFDTQAALNKAAADSPQSMGAAATAPQIGGASAPLQAGFKAAAQKTGGAVNPEAAANHLEADANGIQLMRGQATRDASQYSEEQNSTHPDVVARRAKQAQQLVDRLDDIRQQNAPSMVQNDKIQNGQVAVDDLKAYDEPIKADIKDSYKALIDANGNKVPIDTGKFLGNVDEKLSNQLLTDSIPPQAQTILNNMRAGKPMNFEQFEAARSRLAEASRENKGTSAGVAAGIVRNELEEMPLSPEAQGLKTLADTARGKAKARFDARDRDPAYDAAVSESESGIKRGTPSPLADNFLDRYVLNAPKANIDTVMSKFSPEGTEAVGAHTLSAIRSKTVNSAGIDTTPNGFNTAMSKYGPKLDSLIPEETKESLESYGRTLNNVKTAPPANHVNYSKSGIVAGQAMGDLAAHTFNAKTLGLGMPVLRSIPGVKNLPGIRKAQDVFAKHALAPGAGLDDLKTTP